MPIQTLGGGEEMDPVLEKFTVYKHMYKKTDS